MNQLPRHYVGLDRLNNIFNFPQQFELFSILQYLMLFVNPATTGFFHEKGHCQDLSSFFHDSWITHESLGKQLCALRHNLTILFSILQTIGGFLYQRIFYGNVDFIYIHKYFRYIYKICFRFYMFAVIAHNAKVYFVIVLFS